MWICCFTYPMAPDPPPAPGSFSSELQSTWNFPRASFASRDSPDGRVALVPEQGKRSPQSPHRKMIASAWGFQRDVLLQLFTNWLYLKLPWGVGAGTKDTSGKTFIGKSEELLKPPRGTSLFKYQQSAFPMCTHDMTAVWNCIACSLIASWKG